MKRRSVIFVEPGRVEIHEEMLPSPGPRQLLIESRYSAVSAGTELLVYRDQMPPGMVVDETIASLGGTFHYPLKYGYAVVGQVMAYGPDVDSNWLGRLVFAFNPHESHFIAGQDDVISVPDDISPEAAVFLPTMETAVSFVMDGRPLIGEQVAVLGQGVVGLLTVALLSRQPLSSLVSVDAIPLRRERSVATGADASVDAADPEVLSLARALLAGDGPYQGADLVYELSGNPAALNLAVGLAGYNSRIVAGSWYGDKRAAVDLGGHFHRSHMNIISSQVSHIAPQWSGRWTKTRRLGVVWEMLRQVQTEQLITHRIPIELAPEAYRQLDHNPAETLQVVFTYAPA